MSVSCKTGFSLQGTATRKCQADGTWTSGKVVCLGTVLVVPHIEPRVVKVNLMSNRAIYYIALRYPVKSVIDFAETYSLFITDPVDSITNP